MNFPLQRIDCKRNIFIHLQSGLSIPIDASCRLWQPTVLYLLRRKQGRPGTLPKNSTLKVWFNMISLWSDIFILLLLNCAQTFDSLLLLVRWSSLKAHVNDKYAQIDDTTIKQQRKRVRVSAMLERSNIIPTNSFDNQMLLRFSSLFCRLQLIDWSATVLPMRLVKRLEPANF